MHIQKLRMGTLAIMRYGDGIPLDDFLNYLDEAFHDILCDVTGECTFVHDTELVLNGANVTIHVPQGVDPAPYDQAIIRSAHRTMEAYGTGYTTAITFTTDYYMEGDPV